MDNDAFAAIKAADDTDQQLVDFRLAIAVTTFANVFNRIIGTANDVPESGNGMARPCSAAYRPEEEATALWRGLTVKLQ